MAFTNANNVAAASFPATVTAASVVMVVAAAAFVLCLPKMSYASPLPWQCRDEISPYQCPDADLLAFALNLEFLEAEFFMFGATGAGLDAHYPQLTGGGKPPRGGRKARLGDPTAKDIVLQMGLQEAGHLRAIRTTLSNIGPREYFPRPLLDLSAQNFANILNSAFNTTLHPPFDPYANDINFLIASYVIPYVGLTGYVGASPKLCTQEFKRVIAGLLGVESGQDAGIRTWLYERRNERMPTYPHLTVANVTDRISQLRNRLGNPQEIKDEGLVVPLSLGVEGKTTGNFLSADVNSLAYGRTACEILGIVYGSGDGHIPGSFFPEGANGRIAKAMLNTRKA